MNAQDAGKKVSSGIITGATRGIGRAILFRCLEEDMKVAFTYKSNEKSKDEILDSAGSLRDNLLPIKLDSREFSSVRAAIDQVINKFGKIDFLVNNSGIVKDRTLMMMSEDEWDDVLDTNLKGTFNFTRSVIIPLMKQRFGVIVNITSVAGLVGIAGQTNYCSSKAGIIGFTKSLAKEVARTGVRVNAVAPGYIETDMTKGLSESFIQERKKSIPAGRFGDAKEVAELVAFLLSEKAQYINGAVIPIDGALTA